MTKATVKIATEEKAALEQRSKALGVPLSEAMRLGAVLYLTSLELQALPKPRRGRPPKVS